MEGALAGVNGLLDLVGKIENPRAAAAAQAFGREFRRVGGVEDVGLLVQHLSLGGEEIELQRHPLNAGDFLGQGALLGGFVGVGPPAADFEFVFAGSGGAPATFLEKLGHGGFSSGYLCRRKGPRGGRFPGCRAFGWDDPLWGEWDDPLWD